MMYLKNYEDNSFYLYLTWCLPISTNNQRPGCKNKNETDNGKRDYPTITLLVKLKTNFAFNTKIDHFEFF